MKASRTVGGIKEITKYMTVSQLGTHPFSTPCCVYVEIFSSKSTVHFPEDVNSSLARLFHLPFGKMKLKKKIFFTCSVKKLELVEKNFE